MTLVRSFYIPARHALMITTRTTSTPFSINGISEMRPVLEPLYISKTNKDNNVDNLIPENMNFRHENIPQLKKRFGDAFIHNPMVKLFLLTLGCVLFFFIGYQTRKSQENNSYVRLPTTN